MKATELEQFCEETIDEVYRYARRLTGGDAARTADLVQDTYAKLVRHVDAHDDSAVGLPWLITCCRHRFLDSIRLDRRREKVRQRSWTRPAEARANESRLDVVAALRQLKDLDRVALILRHVNGFSIADVASEIGRSEAATDSLLRRGRERLRKELDQQDQRGDA